MSTVVRWFLSVLILAGLAAWPETVSARAMRVVAPNSTAPSVLDGFDPHADQNVAAMVIQPDGKIIVGGQFGMVGGQTHIGLARLNPDGSTEAGFTPAIDADPNLYGVNAFALQSDGKILVGGQFIHLNGLSRPNLGRLNANGSLDAAFNPAINGTVEAVAVQPDGKILIAGQFNQVNGQIHPYVARLNLDGSTDDKFIASASGIVRVMLLQPDGKILLGGGFGGLNNTLQAYFGRLNADGTTDTGFAPQVNGNAFNGFVTCMALQPDGMIVVCPGASPYLMRFKADGSADTLFHPTFDMTVRSVAIQPDGQILAAGAFQSVNSQTHSHLVRLSHSGKNDPSFNTSVDYLVFTMVPQSNGGILLGGQFLNVNNSNPSVPNRYRLARLYPDGSLDDHLRTEMDKNAVALALQPDGKLLLGGGFGTLNASFSHPGLGRLNAGGYLDGAYNPAATGNAIPVLALGVQADSKAVVAGDFTALNSLTHTRVARLKPDGTLDSAYNATASASAVISALVVQQDGQTVIGGLFSSVNNLPHNRLARWTTNGSLDSSFLASASGPNLFTAVNTLALQKDGKILVGGNFTLLDEQPRPSLGRLNVDGTLDSGFTPTVDGSVLAIAVQHDGKIIITGGFSHVNSQARARIARLNANGSLDASFNPGVNGAIYSLVLQSDGAILAGGSFTTIANTNHPYLARLLPGGGLDSSFAIAPDAAVIALLLTPDGKLVFSGNFTNVDGQPRAHLARATLGWQVDSGFSFGPGQGDLTWTRSGPGPEPSWVTFDMSSDGISYTTLGSALPSSSGWSWRGAAFPVGAPLYLRARAGYPGGNYNGSASQMIETHWVTVPDVTLPPPPTGKSIYLPAVQRN